MSIRVRSARPRVERCQTVPLEHIQNQITVGLISSRLIAQMDPWTSYAGTGLEDRVQVTGEDEL